MQAVKGLRQAYLQATEVLKHSCESLLPLGSSAVVSCSTIHMLYCLHACPTAACISRTTGSSTFLAAMLAAMLDTIAHTMLATMLQLQSLSLLCYSSLKKPVISPICTTYSLSPLPPSTPLPHSAPSLPSRTYTTHTPINIQKPMQEQRLWYAAHCCTCCCLVWRLCL